MKLTQGMIDCMKVEDRRMLGLQTAPPATSTTKNKPEKQLQRDCENWLRLKGYEFLHLSPRAREKIGWPDLVWPDPARRGQFCCAELKTATGQLSEEQENVLRNLAKCGARIGIIRSLQEFIVFAEGTFNGA